MKKLVFVFALVSVLAVSGCGKSGDIVSSSELPTSSSTEESVSSEESSVPEAEPSSDEPVDNIGGEDYCHSHKFVYHSFETELIQSVGWDEFNAWSDTCTAPCSSNIVEFV